MTVFDWKKRDALQGYNATARAERIRAQISAHKVLALEKPRNRIGNTDAGQPLVIGLNAKAEAAA